MRLPWFMHSHRGVNTLVGVLPTPTGSFVRSCADGRMEATWYPASAGFPGGGDRVSKRVATVDATDAGEVELETAVVDFMHADPALALHRGFDPPARAALTWTPAGGGALETLETRHGLFVSIRHGGTASIEFLPAGGHGRRETLGALADVCDERTMAGRIDALVHRRIDRILAAEARRQAEAA